MIKLTNSVFNNLNFLETVKKIYKKELPAKESYKLLKVLKELNEKSNEYDTIKNKILQETGYEEKNSWKFKTDKDFQKFQDQFNELLDIEIILNAEKIQCPETLQISPQEMELMEDILNYEGLNE